MSGIISPIPIRTPFLERGKDGKFTGSVTWPWIKWLQELKAIAPVDPNALYALTLEEAPTSDIAEQSAQDAIIFDQPETNSINATAVEDIARGVALELVDPPEPPPEYVNGQLVKSQSVTTGSIAASTYASVTLTWTTPFWDANYLAYASVLQSVASVNTLRIHHIESVSATQLVVGVFNDDAGGAHTGTLSVFAIHN